MVLLCLEGKVFYLKAKYDVIFHESKIYRKKGSLRLVCGPCNRVDRFRMVDWCVGLKPLHGSIAGRKWKQKYSNLCHLSF